MRIDHCRPVALAAVRKRFLNARLPSCLSFDRAYSGYTFGVKALKVIKHAGRITGNLFQCIRRKGKEGNEPSIK